jgi:hypothetical protein
LPHVEVGGPHRDAFARPVMRVVQMHDQRADALYVEFIE